MSDDAIREAAARAIADGYTWAEGVTGRMTRDADTVIDAVRPLIEADLRERLAAAIEAERDFWLACDPNPGSPPQGSVRWAVARAYDVTARLCRERP